MASTRNNNWQGNYNLQQKSYHHAANYINSEYGNAYSPAIPSLGYTPSCISRDTLSSNPIEIESALFGINSTNLVNPQPPVVPDLKTIQTKDFFDRMPLIMPKSLVVEKAQRPFPIPE